MLSVASVGALFAVICGVSALAYAIELFGRWNRERRNVYV